MVTIDIIIDSLQKMPKNASYDEILERINFLKAIDEGLEQAKKGKIVSNEDVKSQMKQWLKR